MTSAKPKISVLGMGYVGLPLAVAFGALFHTIGFDINARRIRELKDGFDSTSESTKSEIQEAKNLTFTSNPVDLEYSNYYVVTVPTPIDQYKQPNLEPLRKASEAIGGVLKIGDIVIYESTVYPGATEEECVPVLEQASGLVFNQDFFIGYSPERINPGDSSRRLRDITKITSGSTEEVANEIDSLYASIVKAGTHKVSSIKVAEAAKVIENTQRDLNIGLINELALIFEKLGIDTEEVLEAAGTKWNFLPFRPGLVGGHCIGVDPYYLTYKAQSVGYHPEIILAGRRLNDGMSHYVASQLVKGMLKKRIHIMGARVLVMGVTFKENCGDIRNSKIIEVVKELEDYGIEVDCYDPWVDNKQVANEFQISMIDELKREYYQAILIGVAHRQFKNLHIDQIRDLGTASHVVYDLKYVFSSDDVELRL